MLPLSRDRDIAFAVNSLARYAANPALNILQPPNTSSDTSQEPLHSAFVMTARVAQTSRHTQTRTGPRHSQTAAQLVHSCSSYAEALSPGPHDANAFVSLSSTEAEYIALSQAAVQAAWYRNIADELCIPLSLR